MMNEHRNAMMSAAEQSGASRNQTQIGTVSAYNPTKYSVKVYLQPSGIESGWIPILTTFVGNGWGMQFGPSIGDAVTICFQGGDQDSGLVVGAVFNSQNRPMSVPSGEAWMRHKSGSFLKFHNDGSIEIVAAGNLSATVGGNANIAVTGNITSAATQWSHTGPFSVAGLITGTAGLNVSGGSGAKVTGAITVTGGDINADGYSLKGHHHLAPNGNTGGAIP